MRSELYQVDAAPRAPARLVTLARTYAVTVVVAVVVVLVAYDNGGFGESTRDTLAIALWWVLILALGLGLWPLARVPVAALVTGGLVSAFGVFTLFSTVWADDAGGAYAEFTRVALYVAVFAVAVVASRPGNAARWCDGLALGLVGVMIIALVSRFFPGTLEHPEIAQLVGAETRLSSPLGYWNGLGILLGIGIPLLLRLAVSARSPVVRGLAVAPLPAFAGTIYLTSSRAGVASAMISTAAFLLLTARRWSAAAAVAAAGAGTAAVVLFLSRQDTLVNGPLGSPLAESQGRSAALVVAGLCVLTGLLYGVGCKALKSQVRPSPILGWSLFASTLALIVVGIAAAHPVRRFEEFKSPQIVKTGRSAIEQHLLSGRGNGRWQLWSSAIDEFESTPLEGRGAGSYQAWWLEHGSLPLYVQDAHSLYAETLGELGVVGFVLLVGAFATGLATALVRIVRLKSHQRVVLAAVTSTFLAFCVAAAVDWMWELTIVSVVAFVCLGLASGPATALARGNGLEPRDGRGRGRLAAYVRTIGIVVVGALVICAIGLSLVAGAWISASQDAAARGDLQTAIDRAEQVRSIEPWSSRPYQQLALLQDQAGRYRTARRWIRMAIARDRSDWQLWLIKSRIETELGAIPAAATSIRRIKVLNPHTPLVAQP